MNFGADNLFKKLRCVLLAKPVYYDIIASINPWQEKWIGKIDKKLAMKQHKNMSDALEKEGIKCYFLEPFKGRTDQKDSRDIGLISSKGAVVASLKESARKGEDIKFVKFCKENKIPILNKNIDIRFEGGDFFFVDQNTCLLGIGPRTQLDAKIIKKLLDKSDLKLFYHKSPHHLDAIFNIISKDLVVCHKKSLDEKSLGYLKGKKIVQISDEDIETMSANFLLIKENKILADQGCHKFNKKLEKEGVEVIEVDVSELKKDGGSIRCMTLPILRE